jgi:HAD superfamily hydrolase (TIGR01509 family)
MIDAILFDLDGTLIDTESVAVTAGMAAFEKCGQRVDLAFMHSLVGVDQPTARIRIKSVFPNLEMDRAWQSAFEAAIARDLPIKPGAVQLLEMRLRPMAIVTSSGRAAAHHKLQLANMGGYFEHVITVDDVKMAKPAAEPYLLAAARLGVDPARCLVFEDSETGAEAAHKAGCIVVQIPDVVPSLGRWAHYLAGDLLAGARHYGLID